MIEFIFMLTRDDVTIDAAPAVVGQLAGTGLRYVGFKDVGPPPAVLASVAEAAHESEMEVMLEVVSTTREAEQRSLDAAAAIGVDWVLGGTHPADGVAALAGSGIRYCPFAGTVEGHPSVLCGDAAEIAAHAAALTATDGVDGVDLLAYRHTGTDPVALTRAVAAAASGPVIAAGSVASVAQIEALDRAGAWGFTIGTAIFAGRLPGAPSVRRQVAAVLEAVA